MKFKFLILLAFISGPAFAWTHGVYTPSAIVQANNPDITDYSSSWTISPTDYTNTTAWPRNNISTATAAFNLDTTTTARLISETSTSTLEWSIRQTLTSKLAGTRYHRIARFDLKAAGRTFVRMQVATPDFAQGGNVFFNLSGAGSVNYTATPNVATLTTPGIVSAKIDELAGGFYRCEIDYYTDTIQSGFVEQLFLVTAFNDFTNHAGVVNAGVYMRNGRSNVDANSILVAQLAVPVNTTAPVVWGPSTNASNGDRLTAFYGAWTNQPTAFAYQWVSNGTDIVGQTNPSYTVTSVTAGTTIAVKVTPTNNFGIGSVVTSDGTIFDGVDHTQEWLTTNNFPTAADPSAAASPTFGSFVSTPTNVVNMDFTPTGNVTNRSTLDSLMFYTTLNGASENSYPATAVTDPIDNPTSGSSWARMRRYPAGHQFDLHKFTTDGLKLGVIGKVNGKTAVNGGIYSGGLRPQVSFKPGMYFEVRMKTTSPQNPYAWTPVWLFTGDQISPGRVAGSSNDPIYKPDGTHSLVNRAHLTALATELGAGTGIYHEIDVNDWWKSTATTIGKSLNSGLLVYTSAQRSSLTQDKPYLGFLANDGGFQRNGGSNILTTEPAWDDGNFHTIAFNWRILSQTIESGGTVIRSVTMLDYIKDGKIWRQEYFEYINDYYVDPITGQNTQPGMHILIGGQSHPSFVPGVATSDISNWDTYSFTVNSLKVWQGNIDPATLTKPTNGILAYNALSIANPNATINVAWTSAALDKQLSTSTSSNTKLRGVANDGTILTGSGSNITGTFTTLGTKTITLTEVPDNNSGAGSLSITPGFPTTTSSLTVEVRNVETPIVVPTFTDSAVDSTAASTYTFSGKSFAIGAADASRLVAVGCSARAAGTTVTPNSMTIGGIAATKIVDARNTIDANLTTNSWWQAAVPTGTTATISITYSASVIRAGCVVYSITSSNGVVPTGSAIGTSSVNSGTTSQDVRTSVTVPISGAATILTSINAGGAGPTLSSLNYSQDLAPTLIASNVYMASGSSRNGRNQIFDSIWTTNNSQFNGTQAVVSWSP